MDVKLEGTESRMQQLVFPQQSQLTSIMGDKQIESIVFIANFLEVVCHCFFPVGFSYFH